MMRPALAIIVILAAATAGMLAGRGSRAEPAAPGLRANLLPQDLDGARAPTIRLRDAAGRTVDTRRLDRPYLVSFVYTRCRDVCPLIGDEIGDALRRLGDSAPSAAALLVSVDPPNDTPEAARRWLRRHHLPPQAAYLLGTSRALRPIWRDWYIGGTDPREHDASVWLVDARGRLRGRWSGGEPIDPADMAHDLKALIH